MRPLSAITLIVLGSSFAITVSLLAVLLILKFVASDDPRVPQETDLLKTSIALFLGLTAVSALSFYTSIKTHRLRFWSQAAMWSFLLMIGWYYWP